MFKDSGVPLAAYAAEVLCACPNCRGPALVRGRSKCVIPFWVDVARVQCLRCSFVKHYNEQWHGPMVGYGRERCGQCGHKWLEVQLKRTTKAPIKQEVNARCGECGMDSNIKLKWHREVFTGEPHDPYFGLPLWLQADCCGSTLWAYNGAHLDILKTYLEATQRQRSVNGKWSMITRLPQWMKTAKNRAELLRCVGKLERKLKRVD